MVKKDLIDYLVQSLPGIAKRDMSAAVDVLFETITQALAQGESVDVRGFGRWTVKTRQPLRARNPRTGVPVDVPIRWATHFKSSENLNEQLNK